MTSAFTVRAAVVNDLQKIGDLIHQSFSAMIPFTGESMRTKFEEYVEKIKSSELCEEHFNSVYFKPTDNHFWVAESKSDGVVGCVGLKRLNADDVELVRMSVDGIVRNGGIGKKLVSELIDYSIKKGYLRIVCTTGNPDAARFYEKKCGFQIAERMEFRSPNQDASSPPHVVLKLMKPLFEKKISSVVVIGGTHGNEKIGIELVNQWLSNSSLKSLTRSSFQIIPLIGNPRAVAENKRYINTDLNRLFLGDLSDNDMNNIEDAEVQRAIELNDKLGPKANPLIPCTTDFIIDLHSTNSNVGIVAMISGDSDVFAFRVANHLQSTLFPELKITCYPGEKTKAWSVDSISDSGISFEVGPVVHGTISVVLLEKTRQLVYATLDYIESHNNWLKESNINNNRQLNIITTISDHDAAVSGISNNNENVLNKPTVCIVRDRVLYPTSQLPLFPLQPLLPPFNRMEYYEPYATVDYPRASAVEKDEVVTISSDTTLDIKSESSKSSLVEQKSSPLCLPIIAGIHPNFEGKDWSEVKDQDDVFLSFDGSNTSFPFIKPMKTVGVSSFAPPSNSNTPLFAMFINEASYYEKGIAFSLYEKKSRSIY